MTYQHFMPKQLNKHKLNIAFRYIKLGIKKSVTFLLKQAYENIAPEKALICNQFSIYYSFTIDAVGLEICYKYICSRMLHALILIPSLDISYCSTNMPFCNNIPKICQAKEK